MKRSRHQRRTAMRAPGEGAAIEVRVDDAHIFAGADSDAGAPLAEDFVPLEAGELPLAAAHDEPDASQGMAALADWSSDDAPQRVLRMERQAAELGEYLRARNSELDRREARFNAQVAAIENSTRVARLWTTEQQHALDERAGQFTEQAAVLSERASELAAAEQFLQSARRDLEREIDTRAAGLDRRAEELTAWGLRLERSQTAQAVQAAADQARALQSARDLLAERQRLDQQRAASLEQVRRALLDLERQRLALEQAAAEIDHRHEVRTAELCCLADGVWNRERAVAIQEREFERLGAELDTKQLELARARRQLFDQRHQFEHAQQAAERQLADRRRQFDTDLRHKFAELDRLRESLDGRAAALDRTRDELWNTHRELLETRLATEELWAQMAGRMAGATLPRAVAQARRQLAGHFRLAQQDLEARRTELIDVQVHVRDEMERLLLRRRELDTWLATREVELEQRAAHLEQAREHEPVASLWPELVGRDAA